MDSQVEPDFIDSGGSRGWVVGFKMPDCIGESSETRFIKLEWLLIEHEWRGAIIREG